MTDKRKRTSRAKAPVSAHPAFPAIVALWFAALLGIGTLVLPVVLLERMAEASGLSSLFVAAQAPLGMTARIVIALVAAAIGGLVGIAIAARIAASHKAGDQSSATSASAPFEGQAAKRPISALEELGPDGIDADAADATPTDAESWIDDTEQATPVADHAPFDDSDRAPGHQPQDSEIEAHWHSSTEDALEETRAPLPVDEEFPVEQVGEYREQGFGHAAIDDGQPGTAMPGAAREPSIVELVERFAKALQQHRETTRLEQVRPPVGVSESDEDETFDGPAATAEEGYSSLLAMTGSGPSQRDAVRLAGSGDEPVVPFPSQRPDRAQTEGALRDALEKLQKLSGVA